MVFLRVGFSAMAGENEVQLYAATDAEARKAADAAIEEVRRIEAKYSRYRPDSVVSRINAAAGLGAVEIDAETKQLLDYADTCFRQSEGLFDITSGVLRRTWDFRSGRPPHADAVSALLPLIGWNKVRLESWCESKDDARHDAAAAVSLPAPGMEIDFGGFGKEYAVDRAIFVLASRGIRHGCINLAGDLAVIGSHADGSPWGVGIRHPRIDGALLATLPVHSGAIATSGDYERYFDYEGRRYCHILDPRTGFPAMGLQSATVSAPTCLVAGTATTIAMLKGEAGGLAWLDSLGLPYLAARASGEPVSTFA